ncbi:MAG: DUF2510 domain-containing protein [Acidimicrobiales bacterium]
MTTITLITETPATETPAAETPAIHIHAGSAETAPELVLPTSISKGWHADPMAIHKLRWHDGTEWTERVTHFGPVPCHHCGR